MFDRFFVSLALWLTKNTACAVVRRQHAADLIVAAGELARYVQASGGLQDPKRIHAYKIVTRAADTIEQGASRLLAGYTPDHVLDINLERGVVHAQGVQVQQSLA